MGYKDKCKELTFLLLLSLKDFFFSEKHVSHNTQKDPYEESNIILSGGDMKYSVLFTAKKAGY